VNFTVNSDNELTANTNGGRLTVMGTTTSVATNVTVNSSNAAPYGDATFAATNMPIATNYTAIAADKYGRHSTNTVNVNITTNTTYQYDGNGNLTNDGLRSFAYDNENQLLQVWVTNQWLSQFTYDGKMRRRIRQEYTWQNSGWVQTNQVYYVYDGNVVIQERDINNLPSTTYTRGLDLSSLQGAGGIGGLLAMTLNTASGPASSNSMYYHSDGNGNVTMLLNPWQYIVAKYLYDAFGNTLSSAGSMAQQNLYRFSSKEVQPNSGLIYYLYRYYDPNLQRWPNRDPLEESGFQLLGFSVGNSTAHLARPVLFGCASGNLYEFARNAPTRLYDPHGLADNDLCQALEDKLAYYANIGDEENWLKTFATYQMLCGFPPGSPPKIPLPGCPQDPYRGKPFNPANNMSGLGDFCRKYPGVCVGVPVAVGIGILGFFTGGLGWLLYA
jgi:RHS repeat-associated protein